MNNVREGVIASMVTFIVVLLFGIAASVIGTSLTEPTTDALTDAVVYATYGSTFFAVMTSFTIGTQCIDLDRCNQIDPVAMLTFGGLASGFFGQPLGVLFADDGDARKAFQHAAYGTSILMIACFGSMAACALMCPHVSLGANADDWQAERQPRGVVVLPQIIPPLVPPRVVIVDHPDGHMSLASL
jgi:hypothetical protein